MVIANIHLAILNLVMNSLIDYEVLKLAYFESKGYISLDQIMNHDGTHILSCLTFLSTLYPFLEYFMLINLQYFMSLISFLCNFY